MGDTGAGEEPAPAVFRPPTAPVPRSEWAPRPGWSAGALPEGPAWPPRPRSSRGGDPVAGFVATGCRSLVATWSSPPLAALVTSLETRRPTWRPDARWGDDTARAFGNASGRIRPPPGVETIGNGNTPRLASRLLVPYVAHVISVTTRLRFCKTLEHRTRTVRTAGRFVNREGARRVSMFRRTGRLIFRQHSSAGAAMERFKATVGRGLLVIGFAVAGFQSAAAQVKGVELNGFLVRL